MICYDELVLNRPHLIWQKLVAFYNDSVPTHSNASLISIGLAALQNSQFDTRMDFLVKFLEELHYYNTYSEEMMAPATCIFNLNGAIAEDKILNSEVSRIKSIKPIKIRVKNQRIVSLIYSSKFKQ